MIASLLLSVQLLILCSVRTDIYNRQFLEMRVHVTLLELYYRTAPEDFLYISQRRKFNEVMGSETRNYRSAFAQLNSC